MIPHPAKPDRTCTRVLRMNNGTLHWFVGTRKQPLPVENSIIDGNRERMDDAGCVALEQRVLEAGDTVDIFDGPFCGWSGVFVRDLSDGQRVVILLRALEQCRLVIDRDSVERAEVA